MRKTASIFFLILTICFSIYILYSLHLGIGHGISIRLTQLVERTSHKVEVWLDKAPPSAPQYLRFGPAPRFERRSARLTTIARPSRRIQWRHLIATGGDALVVFAGTHDEALLTPSDNFDNTWISLAGPANFAPANAATNLRGQLVREKCESGSQSRFLDDVIYEGGIGAFHARGEGFECFRSDRCGFDNWQRR